jgi:phage tail-like protein
MAKFANPRKKFNWSIQIVPEAINPFMFQKITLPDIEIEQDTHGDTNHDIKTAGRVSYSNIKAEKLMPSNTSDTYMWAWADSIQSSMIGGGITPASYKKTAIIVELAEDGVTQVNQWIARGVWPTKINGLELDRTASGNSIESFELSVDKLTKV